MCVRTANLEALVRKRSSCIAALEHALGQFAIKGTRPKRLQVLQALSVENGAKRKRTEVDAIEYYTLELSNLNDRIGEEIDLLEKRGQKVEGSKGGREILVDSSRRPSEQKCGRNSAVEAMGASICFKSTAGQADILGSTEPHDIVSLSSLTNGKQEGSLTTTELASSALSSTASVVTANTGSNSLSSAAPGQIEKDVGPGAVLTVNDVASENETGIWNSNCGVVKEDPNKTSVATNGATSTLAEEGENALGGAGFVSFRSLVATQGALQMKHRPEPFSMRIDQAPDPRDIFWGNVETRTVALQAGRFLSVALTMVICFFWTFVVTFIVNLANVEQVSTAVPFVAETVESNRWVESILPLLSPLILQIFNSGLLPVILKAVSRLEFPVSDSLLEASAFWKMAAFTIIQTFL